MSYWHEPTPGMSHRIYTPDSVPVKCLMASWADSFIFSGSSALLLLLANLFPDYWYFSFFALTPFLYRIIKATPVESLRLGFLLGLALFGASTVNSLLTSPFISILKLLSGTALFALFGWSIGWARKHWGFNPSIVAILWVGLEIGLMKLGLTGAHIVAGYPYPATVLVEGKGALDQQIHPFLHGLVTLFGFLTVSAIIVLLNSLLVLAIVKTLELTRPRWNTATENETIWNFFFTRNLFTEKVYLVPEGRAPPSMPECVCI